MHVSQRKVHYLLLLGVTSHNFLHTVRKHQTCNPPKPSLSLAWTTSWIYSWLSWVQMLSHMTRKWPTGCLLPVGVINLVMFYLDIYLFLIIWVKTENSLDKLSLLSTINKPWTFFYPHFYFLRLQNDTTTHPCYLRCLYFCRKFHSPNLVAVLLSLKIHWVTYNPNKTSQACTGGKSEGKKNWRAKRAKR